MEVQPEYTLSVITLYDMMYLTDLISTAYLLTPPNNRMGLCFDWSFTQLLMQVTDSIISHKNADTASTLQQIEMYLFLTGEKAKLK